MVLRVHNIPEPIHPGGSLRHMELFPGVTYTLASEDDADSDSTTVDISQSPYKVIRSGELILFGQYSTCKAYLPGMAWTHRHTHRCIRIGVYVCERLSVRVLSRKYVSMDTSVHGHGCWSVKV